MEYRKRGNGGTAGDFPTENTNKNTKALQHFGATRVPSRTISGGMDVTGIEFQIHCIETEAYAAVLRAFVAQSNVLSWGKEGLISELRKELRVSDVEHRELLVKVNSDDSVRMIRKFREGKAGQKKMLSNAINTPAPVPSSVVDASSKRLKTTLVAVSSSPNHLPHAQPLPSATQLDTHLVDNQLGGGAASLSTKGNVRQSTELVGYNRQASTVSKGRGPVIIQSKNGVLPPYINNFKKRSDTIEICATDKLINKVERLIFRGNHPSAGQVEKAKRILEDHEKAILNALEKLANVSDGDDSPVRSQNLYSYEELQMNGQQKETHDAIYGQVDRIRGYYIDGFDSHH